jgi:hypothetical protein
MKKISLIGLLLAAVSCGDTPSGPGVNDKVGQVRALSGAESFVSGETRNAVIAICNSLAQKEAQIQTQVNSPLTFNVGQTDCAGNTISSAPVTVTIQQSGTNFVFRRLDGQEFIFPNVETRTSGIFADICANQNNLTSPIVGVTEATYFTVSGINPQDCSPLSGEICIQVEKAFIEGTTATVHTREWLRVRTSSNNGLIGHFTQRKKITRSFCGLNETVSFSATLK